MLISRRTISSAETKTAVTQPVATRRLFVVVVITSCCSSSTPADIPVLIFQVYQIQFLHSSRSIRFSVVCLLKDRYVVAISNYVHRYRESRASHFSFFPFSSSKVSASAIARSRAKHLLHPSSTWKLHLPRSRKPKMIFTLHTTHKTQTNLAASSADRTYLEES